MKSRVHATFDFRMGIPATDVLQGGYCVPRLVARILHGRREAYSFEKLQGS
jgi:hypothetical protein